MSEPTMDHFSVKTGWDLVPDPFADSNEEELRALGFTQFNQIGVEGDFQVLVYAGPAGQFLVYIDGMDSSVRTIMAADLPSMVELVSKLAPMALSSHLRALEVIATDLNELSIGERGPLQEAHQARWHRRRQEVEKARAKSIG